MGHLAIREGWGQLAIDLVSQGMDINATNELGRTPLQQAILRKLDDVAFVLLDSNVDLTTRDYLYESALTYALKTCNDSVAARIVFQSSLDEIDDAFTNLAVSYCNEHIFVSSGVNLTRPSSNAVLKSCANGMPLTAVTLIWSGVPLTGIDQFGRTALHYAYAYQMEDVIEALITHGADESIVDSAGLSPAKGALQVACFKNRSTVPTQVG